MNKWCKKNKYIEIVCAMSAAYSENPLAINVYFVRSNIDSYKKGLPLEWRYNVLVNDKEKVKELFDSIEKWAKDNYYKRTYE